MQLIGSDQLTQFLNRAAETPFVWGQFDCLTWLADFVAMRRGVDPAEDLRGTYCTLLGAARIVKQAAGMVALVDHQLQAVGVERAVIPARGDIAVVSVPGVGGEHFGNEAGAILLGGTAALICQTGLFFPRLAFVPLVAAWRV
jgi:hypothetical protein